MIKKNGEEILLNFSFTVQGNHVIVFISPTQNQLIEEPSDSLEEKLYEALTDVPHDFDFRSSVEGDHAVLKLTEALLYDELQRFETLLTTFHSQYIKKHLKFQIAEKLTPALERVYEVFQTNYSSDSQCNRAFITVVLLRLFIPRLKTEQDLLAAKQIMEECYMMTEVPEDMGSTSSVALTLKHREESVFSPNAEPMRVLHPSIDESQDDISAILFEKYPSLRPYLRFPTAGIKQIKDVSCLQTIVQDVDLVEIHRIFKLDRNHSLLWTANSLSWYLLQDLWPALCYPFYDKLLQPLFGLLSTISLAENPAVSVKEVVETFLQEMEQSLGLIPPEIRMTLQISPLLAKQTLIPLLKIQIYEGPDASKLSRSAEDGFKQFFGWLEAIASGTSTPTTAKWFTKQNKRWHRFWDYFLTGFGTTFYPDEKLVVSKIRSAINAEVFPHVGSSDPFSIHKPITSLYTRFWALYREIQVVDHTLTRHEKEAIAIAVSLQNNCTYGVENSKFVMKVTGKESINAYLNPEASFLKDSERPIYALAQALAHGNLSQLDSAVKGIPKPKLGEAIGVFLLTHYMNRVTQIQLKGHFLPPVPLLEEFMASDMLVGNRIKKKYAPRESLPYIGYLHPDVENGYCLPPPLARIIPKNTDMRVVISAMDYELSHLEQATIPESVQQFLSDQLSYWQGEQMPASPWFNTILTDAVNKNQLDVSQQDLALFALLVAQDPVKVSSHLRKVLSHKLNREQFTTLLCWAAWRSAVRRVEIFSQYLSEDFSD